MPKIIVKNPFRYAFRGCDVVEFNAGEHDVAEEVATLALAEGWADQSEPEVLQQDPAPATGRTRKTKD